MDTTKIKETQMTKTPEELTADWNAGKLEPGWYYVKFADEIYPDYFNSYFIQTGDKCGIEVLAPVPDYEEFESLRKTANGVKYVSDKCWEKTKALEGNVTMFKSLFRQYLEREKDIESLRALLKECLPIVSAEIMSWQIRGSKEDTQRGKELLTRINEVLK